MTYFPLTPDQRRWQERAQAIASEVLAPRAAEADQKVIFPHEQLQALRDAGFFGIRADRELGGQGEGLLTTCLVVETLAKACPSTALIYKMHVESSEIVSRVPTEAQKDVFARRVATGEWLSTVAGSETGHQGGAWAGAPKAAVKPVDGGFEIKDVQKAFVTAAGIADTYLFMATLREEGKPPAPLMFQIARDDLEWTIDGPWDGLGMRANGSSPMTFNGFLPSERRLNPENKPVDFYSVAVGTYAATYLGIAAGCYELLEQHVREGTLADGRRMPEVETIANRVVRAKVEIERSRALLYAATCAWDEGRVKGPQAMFEAKVAADETAAFVTGEAMTLGGGTAYARRLPFERYFRDARAGMVMGVAHDIAVLNIARAIYPKPKEEKAAPKKRATKRSSGAS
jgi:alkylation response protein AidB-like acyl-CoA dehydrogenase